MQLLPQTSHLIQFQQLPAMMSDTKCLLFITEVQDRPWTGRNKPILLIHLFVSLVNLVQVGPIQQSFLVQDTRVSIQTKFLQVSTE